MIKFSRKEVSYMAFYRRIRDLREDSDKTQAEIAEYLGTTAQYYGKYEKGERELPFFRAIQIAQYYDVSLDYIAERNHSKPEKYLRDDEVKLVEKWRKLSEKNRGAIMYLLDELSAAQENKKNTNE